VHIVVAVAEAFAVVAVEASAVVAAVQTGRIGRVPAD
jgi:hypothetical protein